MKNEKTALKRLKSRFYNWCYSENHEERLINFVYVFLMPLTIIAVSLSRSFPNVLKIILLMNNTENTHKAHLPIFSLPVIYPGNQINLETLLKHMGCAQAHFSATAHSVVPLRICALDLPARLQSKGIERGDERRERPLPPEQDFISRRNFKFQRLLAPRYAL